jgi:hypothetical protein
MLFWLGRKEFRFNFAKGCAFFSKVRLDNHTKLEYLVLSLNSYNKFLQRTVGVRMNELIQSTIARAAINNPERINEIASFFDSQDRLSAATQMSKMPILNLINDKFFVKAKR